MQEGQAQGRGWQAQQGEERQDEQRAAVAAQGQELNAATSLNFTAPATPGHKNQKQTKNMAWTDTKTF